MQQEQLNELIVTETLKTAIKEYKTIQEKEKELAKNKGELKNVICELLDKLNVTEFQFDDSLATVVEKTTFKYIDELKMIEELKKNDLTKGYVKEHIDTSINKVLKSDTQLAKELADYYTKNISKSLNVK